MAEPNPSGEGVFRRDVLPNRRDAMERAARDVIEALEAGSYDPTAVFAIRLALEEALTNAFKHGNREDPKKTVTVQCAIEPRRVVIEISDEGPGFDPGTVPDPTAEENIEIPSGRGIVLMQSFMTKVEYLPPGNRVRLVYEKPAE
jgi:serine/threonine-protein kinase RsbW